MHVQNPPHYKLDWVHLYKDVFSVYPVLVNLLQPLHSHASNNCRLHHLWLVANYIQAHCIITWRSTCISHTVVPCAHANTVQSCLSAYPFGRKIYPEVKMGSPLTPSTTICDHVRLPSSWYDVGIDSSWSDNTWPDNNKDRCANHHPIKNLFTIF